MNKRSQDVSATASYRFHAENASLPVGVQADSTSVIARVSARSASKGFSATTAVQTLACAAGWFCFTQAVVASRFSLAVE